MGEDHPAGLPSTSVDDKELQARGKAREIKGKSRAKVGDAKEKTESAVADIKRGARKELDEIG